MHHPNAAIGSSILPVNASYDIEFQLAELAYRQILVRTQQQEFSVFGGGRFGQLDQRFQQTGVFGAGPAANVATTTDIEFSGGGPMVGIDGDQRIGTGPIGRTQNRAEVARFLDVLGDDVPAPFERVRLDVARADQRREQRQVGERRRVVVAPVEEQRRLHHVGQVGECGALQREELEDGRQRHLVVGAAPRARLRIRDVAAVPLRDHRAPERHRRQALQPR